MELKRLRYFAAVAETLHFSRAAENLRLAQPALSQQIQLLEKELGVSLFDRDRRHVRLTPVGRLFLVEVRQLLAQAERARLVAERARRGEIGHIEVAHVGSVDYSGVLARSVIALKREAPDVVLNLHDLELESQLDQLADGRLDVAFLRLPISERAAEMAVLPICEEGVLVALPSGHRLADHELVEPGDLAGDAFLATTLREGLGFFQTQLDVCRDAGFEPRIVSRSRHFAAMMSLVAAGQGVAFVPSPVSRLALPGVSYRPLNSERRSQVVALHRREQPGPALARYLRICAQAGQTAGP